MARLVDERLCTYGTEWAWSFRGMGSKDSPTHTQEDCMERGLGVLKFAQFAVLFFTCQWLELCCSLPYCYISYCGVPDVRGNMWSIRVGRARSDHDSFRAAGVGASLIRNYGVKE
eukprot:scaffold98840_cov21-Tisochrysis_lutea.AAC.1